MELSQREKLLLVVAFAVLLPLIVYQYGYQPLVNKHYQTIEKIASLRSKTDQIENLGNKIRLLNQHRVRRSGKLSGRVDRLVKQLGLRANSTISMGDTPQSGQKLALKVIDINLSQFVKLIYKIENEDPTIIIENFELSPSFQNRKLLRININLISR
ncbi:MAG: type II secretion system protein M [Proteobacteria bacterium]|nr:type II secretion system protein M [Pseudomonadota bacterium]